MHRLLVILVVVPGLAYAQATGNPSFTAPRAAYQQSEMGLSVSLAEPLGMGWEALYRYRDREAAVDLTARGGVFEHRGALPRSMLIGLELRKEIPWRGDRVLDAAFIAGIGGRVREEAAAFMVPMGLSLGRRWALPGSAALTTYVQPTLFVRYGTAVRSEVLGVLGFGADLALGIADLRVGAGIGAVRGASIGAVFRQ
jgi:hypothetical protein